MNIFETLPINFFNIFNNSNKGMISECLFVLYDYMKEDSAFASLKENVIFELTKYFNSHIIETDEIASGTPKERADNIYKRLKDCGWISEEQGDNYQIYASFEDYATSIMNILFQLDADADVEYSSMVYNIYSSFVRFDVNNGHKILDSHYRTTKELMNKLKNLNTNIKRYIKKLLRDNMKNDLNQLLDSLLNEYQLMIVDRAFYNLTTRDHPLKYRNTIIAAISEIRNSEEKINCIVRNIMDSKDITYEKAYDIFDEQTNYMIDSFESILDLINEISKKNEKFVASATNRILFLINVKEDIGGKINEIIKSGQQYDGSLNNIVELSVNKTLDSHSIFSSRKQKLPMHLESIKEVKLDDLIREQEINRLKVNSKYTQQSIEKRILERLDGNSVLNGSVYFKEQMDISLFVLTWLYGYNEKSKYKIEPLNTLVNTNQYKFREFIIKEKK
ncbi:hypothetical protein M2475_001963 [Breznakia sp. PF5-3]|uniref:Wadjet anti-phage system protein JetA family protein n=1 Tax=unclassified Breznakia TaxID=2623764 RepID=UPI00240753B4|nr:MULTISPECIES: Wadjet anti-phage system protein JetA family protein [unclassified Breznakia]MDL2276821.1 DUF5716 family protein [Breznakia sp. OttesenSCG-928-G09]MDF9825516.1 hypothetical protein [Breznakia sp. PM6-1]MDF9836383.1 hypothetical protein [Breznakia sp. PF5-3]MDF9838727.1 hypothetical protein [Breznakia sp. PFB2-8]MDF9860535.1 hypothetical protein [Breznakia sp. PH5-24]